MKERRGERRDRDLETQCYGDRRNSQVEGMGQGQAGLGGRVDHRDAFWHPDKLWEIISLLRSPRHHLAINGWHQTCLPNLFSTESCFHSQAAAYHGVDAFERTGRRERKRERKKEEKGSWMNLKDYIKRCGEFFFPPALQINLSQTKFSNSY